MTDQQYTTIIEMLSQMQSSILGLSERVERVEARVDIIEAKVDRIEARVDAIEAKVDRLETKVEAVEAKVDALGARMGSLESKVDTLESTETTHYTELVDLINGIAQTMSEHTIDTQRVQKARLDSHDGRIGTLEQLVLR